MLVYRIKPFIYNGFSNYVCFLLTTCNLKDEYVI